jgi:dUTPase
MNNSPVTIPFSSTNSSAPTRRADSVLHVLKAKNATSIAAGSSALVGTGYSLTLPAVVVMEIVPSRDVAWKDKVIVRRDIFTSTDTSEVQVWVYNFGPGAVNISAGAELCWAKFSSHVRVSL